ncbi:deoxyguanosinetriphosphate triphosphohydrolase [Microcoleus sp. B5-D4]|uniref:deoxyguanosinetriphosphate triphosphohydrolase n=1 Tax=Microcoleus sp. B5-D4 TaxID=2818681 RepID=UPI002FD20C7E
MMQWNKLLTKQRLGKDKPEKPEDARTSFQRDYDRLVFSSPFRRLKDKTQVFSLAKNDYIRTRLIHSLEVSCVGRSLGTIVGYKIKERHKLDEFTASDFGDIVAAACLAHDIGNPPFGHAGEDAIRSGFASWYETVKEKLTLRKQEKADLDLFEGNAQGFRILTRLGMQARTGGMQLTCPTLATFTKYPRESLISTDILNDYSGKSAKKHGFFQAEKELFATVADTVGLIRRSPDVAWWSRHPLAFLVEAADDICYHIVDLEDGYRMGYISFKKAKKLLNEIAKRPDIEQKANTKEEQIKFLRAIAINNLVQEVATIFLEREQELLAGIFDGDLISLTSYAETLNCIQSKTRNKVFNHSEVIGIQVAGYEVLGHLFTEFVNSTLYSTKKGKLVKLMLPKEFCPAESESSYRKILKITDYISGMTDSYATTLFQQLKGISLR